MIKQTPCWQSLAVFLNKIKECCQIKSQIIIQSRVTVFSSQLQSSPLPSPRGSFLSFFKLLKMEFFFDFFCSMFIVCIQKNDQVLYVDFCFLLCSEYLSVLNVFWSSHWSLSTIRQCHLHIQIIWFLFCCVSFIPFSFLIAIAKALILHYIRRKKMAIYILFLILEEMILISSHLL